jgi:hypothetical protein
MKTKICTKCNKEKQLRYFHNDKSHKDGLCSVCKECRKKYKKSYEQKTNYTKQYFKRNHKKLLQYLKEYRKINKLKLKEKRNLRKKLYPELIKQIAKRHYNKYKNTHFFKNKRRIAKNKKYKTNLQFQIKERLSARLIIALKNNIKSSRAIELLGCSLNEFKIYLKNKFIKNMTWKKFMNGKIHIDHIKPCRLFDLSKVEEQRKCFHYTNLQPLWAKDNLKKQGTFQE